VARIGQALSFSLQDEVDGRPLTPENVDLLTLHQFLGEVIELIQGEAKRAEMGQPTVATEEVLELRLIEVVRPLKDIDEDKLKSLWRKGRVAWSGISSPTEWVENLRES